MGSYVVLARKWRPAQFSDIVGQGHIVRTLTNAIRAQRIHQAYLFTGSRGIGKTSIARIFAKILRCENTQLETLAPKPGQEAPTEWLRSCDHCASCKEITTGNGVDVIEIDGASNNGVDHVREIRENAKYLPATGSKKIYIIDEVHMLTTAAFNALLKTLEEPPAHVIFIFATTEPHKIPATILSRCQRFDYRRVTLAQIQNRLIEVTQAEEISHEAGALALIARAAEGSMRDALSLLDQVIAFSGNRLTIASVRESVGLIEGQTLLGILTAVFAKKPLDALALVEQAYSRGHDLRVLSRSLIEFLHGAVLAKVGASNSATLELSEEEWNELKNTAALRPLEEIELIFQVLHHGLDWIARSTQPKIVLDILLVKCATADALIEISGNSSSSSEPASKVLTSNVTPPPAAILSNAPAMSLAGLVSSAAAMNPPTPRASVSWEGLIQHIRGSRPLLATLLEHGNCSKLPIDTDLLEVCFNPKDTYFRDQLQSRVYHEQLMTLSKEYFGKHIRTQIELRDEGESVASRRERESKERSQNARTAAQNHPIIREARALFGGELGPIELPDEGKDAD